MTIFFNYCFDKRRFSTFLKWFFRKNGHQKLLKLLEKLKFVGFHSATEAGFSISIEDLKIPELKSKILFNNASTNQDLTPIENYQKIIECWNYTNEKLKYQVLQSFQISDLMSPVYLMAFSGARGNISQIRQLVSMRGLMADPQGQIIDFPIRSNFREGLTLTEYLVSCSGARKGIVDTALRTAASGYLTRRLVDVAHHVIISQIDCGSKKGLFLENLYDSSSKKASASLGLFGEKKKKILSLEQRLIGRILAETILVSERKIIGKKNQEISKSISVQICNYRQRVLIRSPLTCSSSKFICQLCYGWNLAEGQLVSIGEAVGILAAQSIGEPGTQLTMRTFHTGGVFTGTIIDQTYSPCAGHILYPFYLNGLLIRTQQGHIAYLTKNSGILKIKSKRTKKLSSNFNRLLAFNTGKLGSSINKFQNPFLYNILQTIGRALEEGRAQKKHIFRDFFFIFQNATVLYVRQGEQIRQNQLLAEVPFFQTKNENVDEDRSQGEPVEKEQEVFSSISGEIYFENTILFEKTIFELSRENFVSTKLMHEVQFKKLSEFWILLGRPTSKFFFQKLDLISGHLPFNQIEIPIFIKAKNQNFIFKKISYYINKHSITSSSQKNQEISKFRLNSKRWEFFLPAFRLQTSPLKFLWSSSMSNSNHYWGILELCTCNIFSLQGFLKKKNLVIYRASLHFQAQKTIFQNLKLSYFLNLFFFRLIKRAQNWSKFWKRNQKNNQLKIIHWKNISLHKYIFVINLIYTKIYLTNKIKYSNKLNLGNYSFIRIPIYLLKKKKYDFFSIKSNAFEEGQSSRRGSISKFFIEIQYPKDEDANLSQIFTLTPPIHENFSQNLQNTYLQKLNWNYWSSYLDFKTETKVVKKIVYKYLNTYRFLLINFINFRNYKVRFLKNTSEMPLLRIRYSIRVQNVSFHNENANANANTNAITAVLQKKDFKKLKNVFLKKQPKTLKIIQRHYYRSGKNKIFVRYFKNFKNSEILDLRVKNKKNIFITISDLFGQDVKMQKCNLGSLIRTPKGGQKIAEIQNISLYRKATNYLLNNQSILYGQYGSLCEQNQRLYTVFYSQPKTGDIVQGIPKIEQILEVRKTLSASLILFDFQNLQKSVVNNIQRIYGGQGIYISDKHIEIIVRQMTSNALILEPGQTGLLCGEIVALQWIERINSKVSNKVIYEPILMGMTQTCLEMSSFLSAASFQETTRVLSRAALQNQIDFIRGIKQNVILGNLIPIGTGCF
uniref:DNA-directed RNA polymerase n=1 Tax=Halimeda micronesica TaxID=170426 RepID=A0A386AXB4_9CHLO|nr:RNA polymerase b-subunit [Halimeda micronesica]